jgi:UDP-3-O-acyl-N-acetylglucosamine deacetylase
MTEEKNTETTEANVGAFASSLKRNNSKIRSDRAEAISEDTELVYKRTIEDTRLRIKKWIRERDNMLDLSPTDATSLILASDFDESVFVGSDVKYSVNIRNEEIKLDIIQTRYKHLFGGVV